MSIHSARQIYHDISICQPCYSMPEKWQRNAGSRWNINKAQWRKKGSRRCFLFQNRLCVSASRPKAAVTQWNSYYHYQAPCFTHFLHPNNIQYTIFFFQLQAKNLHIVMNKDQSLFQTFVFEKINKLIIILVILSISWFYLLYLLLC